MTMNIGHEMSSEDEPLMEINTTPLIDVMLVLLVMLIITIPVQLHAVNLDLPTSAAAPHKEKPEVVDVDIDGEDVIHWRGQAMAGRTELDVNMRIAAAQAVPPQIRIRPETRTHYESVATVMVAARQAGLTKLGVVDASSPR